MPQNNGASALPLWRHIPLSPYRSYEVSSDGRVRRGHRELRGDTDRYGYRRVKLSYAGIGKHFKVHRLVCEAFNGPAPSHKHEVGHMDGNALNNTAVNLKWVTRSENNSQKVVHGTHSGAANLTAGVGIGEDNPCSRLKVADVRHIRDLRKQGLSERHIAKMTGVSNSQVHKIVTGKAWSNV